MTLAHAARQPRQHPRRKSRAERDAVAAVADRAQRRVRGDAQVHGRHRLPHRLHSFDPTGAASTPCARPSTASATRPRKACAGLPARRADRRQRRRRSRRAADDPGGGLRAFLPGAPVAAHLHLAQRALGRVPRRALCRRHHRRRRHHGESLPRRGDHRRPPRPRPVRQADRSASAWPTTRRRSTTACSRSCPRWASRCCRPIAAAATSRRSACRARWSPSSSPACRRASPASACAACRRRSPSSTPAPSTRTWSPCRSAASTRRGAAATGTISRATSSTCCRTR